VFGEFMKMVFCSFAFRIKQDVCSANTLRSVNKLGLFTAVVAEEQILSHFIILTLFDLSDFVRPALEGKELTVLLGTKSNQHTITKLKWFISVESQTTKIKKAQVSLVKVIKRTNNLFLKNKNLSL